MIWTDDSSRIGSSTQEPVSPFALPAAPEKPPTKLNFKAELMGLALALMVFNFALSVVLTSMGLAR